MQDKEKTPRYLAIGNIVGVHGIRGEIKVEILTDYPERFRPGAELFIGDEHEARPVEITAARPHKAAMLLKLASVPDRNAAELLRGQLLLIPSEQAMPLDEHENYAHDLIGLTVETSQGNVIGKLIEILYTAANDVYVVQGPQGEVLIPATREVVLRVDLEAGRMLVALPEGLADDTIA